VPRRRGKKPGNPASSVYGRAGVRKIPRSRRSATGAFWSLKNRDLVPFESSLERDLLMLLEFEDYVSGYEAQPVRFRYRAASGRKTSGVIDLALEHNGERFAYVDVKFRREIVHYWQRLKARFSGARDHADSENRDYFIRTEKHIRTQYMLNRRFLYPFLKRAANPDHISILVKSLSSGAMSVADLLNKCAADRELQSEIVPTLWHCVATGQFQCDNTKPITLDTKVWIADRLE